MSDRAGELRGQRGAEHGLRQPINGRAVLPAFQLIDPTAARQAPTRLVLGL